MIVYFADRQLNILGQASTELPSGLVVKDDLKTEDIESGVAVFDCTIPFADETRALVEACTKSGNYILRSYDDANEFYTIVEREIDTKKQEVPVYAEDAGLDLLNETVGAYEADAAYPISHYIELFAFDSGFEIGINEASDLTRKLSWDGESTAAERIASVANQFDGCEISFSFAIKGLEITNKYINIYRERGKDIGENLRLNEDIDKIVTKESIINLATALKCTGGTPDQTTDILEISSDSGTPKVLYKVSLETLSRSADSAEISASVSASLDTEEAQFGKGYVITASIYMGGAWHSVALKETDEEWKGTASHSKDFTFTISGLSAAAITYTDVKFKVSRSDGGTAGVLSEKVCAQYVVTNYIVGGENGEAANSRPMTLDGYTYDDGNFYIDGTFLKSREALKKWSRYSWTKEPNQTEAGGHITRPFSFDTLSQKELLEHALTELKKACEMEVNYEVDIKKLPENIKIGDRINIIDDAGELYVSARVLKLEVSVADQEQKATLGEFLIKSSGISQKVLELADKFASASASAARANIIAKNAQKEAKNAQAQAKSALASSQTAQQAANAATTAANTASQSALQAQDKANAAQEAVGKVEESVSSLETTVTNAKTAADNAYIAAGTAQEKANEAASAAAQAKADAAEAAEQVEIAQGKAETAVTKAETAQSTAETATTEAQAAKATAEAAKLDAEQAEKDIASLGSRLDTVSRTMEADYARKTDLTETEASLQTQISQNAAEIRSHAESIVTIDETVNNAAEQAAQAQTTAAAAQAQADQATADAQAAQNAATAAANAASAAQSEADSAKAAAATAKSVADKAEEDLEAAKADLATVSSRVGATEEEIAAAQQAVQAAQTAADKAKDDAAVADKKAADAQSAANTAAEKADTAKDAADAAADKAQTAQEAANEAKGDAAAAIAKANEAADAATAAQTTANTAKTNAANAQAKADKAAEDAQAAQKAADDADAKAAQAASDLATAQQNLANVTSRVGATEEEVAAAQAAVETAQAAANKAKEDAAAAQSTADTAKTNAATAQTAANQAKSAADLAQAAADAAQQAADEAQRAVDNLAVRVTKAETDISQTSTAITLLATKEEVTNTLAKIKVEADKITSQATQIDALGTKTSSLEQRADGFDVSIADSAKTATAFLSYDATNGLQVGNKQSGSWSGYRAQIKNDAYNILNASGAQLASFAANLVDIGKNSQDSVIRFCNGLASIFYDAAQQYARIQGEKLVLTAPNMAAVQSHQKASSGESYTNDCWISTSATGSTADIRIAASRYLTDADDHPVDSDAVESSIYVHNEGVTVQSTNDIQLIAPIVNIQGDVGITGHYYDNLGQPIRNGLAAYNGGGDSGIDPNTTLEELILTSHSHAPQGLGTFYFIHTVFYGGKSTTANRAQLAFPYNSAGAIYFRYYSGSWSAWRKPFYSGDDAEFSKIELIRGTPYIDFRHGSSNADYTQRIITSSGGLLIYGTTNTYVAVMSDRFRSNGNDVHYLGDSSNKWKAVYAVSGSIQTSDRNQKKNIESIDDRYVALFDKLQPVTFEFNDAESDRVHIGFISQDVKAAMDEVGLTDLDFAGYCRDIKMETVEVTDPETGYTSQVEKEVLDENGDPAYLYSLRYSEFIALNSKMIQLNRQKIAEQEKEIQTLRDELAALKETVALLVGRDKEA